MVDSGFSKASSDNLPYVDVYMIDDFYLNHQLTNVENRHVKAKRSARPSYGDNAVGYVQIKRTGPVCTIKAKITPEHRVHSTYYSILTEIDEIGNIVKRCECILCAASNDHCKHAVAFLFWLHRRSEEPSVTSQQCYWKKSVLSTVGKNLKTDLASLVKKDLPKITPKGSAFLNSIVADSTDAVGGLFDLSTNNSLGVVSLHQISLKFAMIQDISQTAENFILFAADKMSEEFCNKVEMLTREQSGTSLWYEMKFCRITASKIFEASNCKTYDGSLVENIMGAGTFSGTEATKRGLRLEPDVIKAVEKKKLTLKKVDCYYGTNILYLEHHLMGSLRIT